MLIYASNLSGGEAETGHIPRLLSVFQDSEQSCLKTKASGPEERQVGLSSDLTHTCMHICTYMSTGMHAHNHEQEMSKAVFARLLLGNEFCYFDICTQMAQLSSAHSSDANSSHRVCTTRHPVTSCL